jgi:hypothetical protein
MRLLNPRRELFFLLVILFIPILKLLPILLQIIHLSLLLVLLIFLAAKISLTRRRARTTIAIPALSSIHILLIRAILRVFFFLFIILSSLLLISLILLSIFCDLSGEI